MEPQIVVQPLLSDRQTRIRDISQLPSVSGKDSQWHSLPIGPMQPLPAGQEEAFLAAVQGVPEARLW